MDNSVLNVKVVVEIMSKKGRSYWRSGSGETLREALIAVVAVGKKNGALISSDCKKMIKEELCWVELGLKERERDSGKAVVVGEMTEEEMDLEFLGKSRGGKGKKRVLKIVKNRENKRVQMYK